MAQALKDAIDTKTKCKAVPGSVMNERYLFPIDVENIIDSFTEKEFPAFSLNVDYGCVNINLDGECVKIVAQGCDHDPRGSSWFSAHEFKQFTEGCNKIVEWLNEQKD